MILSKTHLFVLSFLVLTLFVIITANYSQYYIPDGDVFFPIAFVFLVFLFCQDLIDCNKTLDVCVYCLICLFVFCFHCLASFQPPNVRLFVEIFSVSSFLYLKPEARLWVYDKFIRILALFLFVAILEYLLVHVGISFSFGESVRPGSTWRYHQGLLNLIPFYKVGFFRFHFITEEPGFIGTLCFFIIATLDKKKYKREFIVFTFAGMITFSLAFYLLCFLWGLSKIKPSNFKFLLIPLVLYAFFHGPINEMIIDRTITQSEEGTLDNRNSFKMNRLFMEMCENGKIIVGIGYHELYEQKKNLNLGFSSGLKSFCMQYGVVGFFLVLASFSYMFFRYNKINYSNVVVLILFWFSFYQRSNLNLETNIVVLFSYSLVQNRQPLLEAECV
jgi:hypothetical protein